jgi:hypothetical protein
MNENMKMVMNFIKAVEEAKFTQLGQTEIDLKMDAATAMYHLKALALDHKHELDIMEIKLEFK